MERLISLPEFIKDKILDSDMQTSFHWGKQQELNRFLALDKEFRMEALLQNGSTKGSFPLAWLVTGWSTEPLIDEGLLFTNCRMVFMEQTEKEWLNPKRWENTFKKLYETVPCFLKLFGRGDSEIPENTPWKTKEEENYSINRKNAVPEHVDAITLDFSLKIYSKYKC